MVVLDQDGKTDIYEGEEVIVYATSGFKGEDVEPDIAKEEFDIEMYAHEASINIGKYKEDLK